MIQERIAEVPIAVGQDLGARIEQITDDLVMNSPKRGLLFPTPREVKFILVSLLRFDDAYYSN